jgi:hypothetical protein
MERPTWYAIFVSKERKNLVSLNKSYTLVLEELKTWLESMCEHKVIIMPNSTNPIKEKTEPILRDVDHLIEIHRNTYPTFPCSVKLQKTTCSSYGNAF